VCLAALMLPAAALASHQADPHSNNVVPLGESPEPLIANANLNSDIAFWRNLAVEGSYDGFRVLDISNPMAPTEIADVLCGASQGDITISPDGNILVRSQDSARQLPGNDASQACTDTHTGALSNGWEGLQIFDFSNKTAPRFVKSVFLDFGSHTHTQYYDKANNRLVIYVSRGGTTGSVGGYGTPSTNPYGGQNWPTNTGCISAVTIPLGNPADAAVANRCIPAGQGGCHDVSVYEGLKRLYGACRPSMILWDISDPVNPREVHSAMIPEVFRVQGPTGGYHSAAFSWNGQYLYGGWEPGGGSQPRCQATGSPIASTTTPVQTDEMKTIFIFRASDGSLVGRFVLPRAQTAAENCTIHNYNLAPYPDKHILVMGNYQAGMGVVDMTNPENPREIAYSDMLPLDADPVAPGIQPNTAGGEWSTHWYNNLIYASDIQEGVNIWDINEPWWENAPSLPFLNPQTTTEPMRCSVSLSSSALRAGRATRVRATSRVTGPNTSATPLANLTVSFRAPGVNKTLKTNRNGVASLAVKARTRGNLRVNVSALNVRACSASKRIAAAPRRAGVAGAGSGGAALTGRVR